MASFPKNAVLRFFLFLPTHLPHIQRPHLVREIVGVAPPLEGLKAPG